MVARGNCWRVLGSLLCCLDLQRHDAEEQGQGTPLRGGRAETR